MKKRFFWSILGATILLIVFITVDAIKGDITSASVAEAVSLSIFYALGIFTGYGIGQNNK